MGGSEQAGDVAEEDTLLNPNMSSFPYCPSSSSMTRLRNRKPRSSAANPNQVVCRGQMRTSDSDAAADHHDVGQRSLDPSSSQSTRTPPPANGWGAGLRRWTMASQKQKTPEMETLEPASSPLSSHPNTTLGTLSDWNQDSLLMDAMKCDTVFRQAAAYAAATWLILVATVYILCSDAQPSVVERLQGVEKEAAMWAFFMLLMAHLMLQVSSVVNQSHPVIGWVLGALTDQINRPPPPSSSRQSNASSDSPSPRRQSPPTSGILVAAITVQLVAIATNFLLAFCPTLVMVDPVTGARVFLLRWCEWTPLAGLMTFLAEAVDLPPHRPGMRTRALSGLAQSLSCLCGLIFPFCYGWLDWTFWMIIACVTYLYIFYRVHVKRQRYLRTPRGTSLAEQEYYHRIAFAYYLVLTCAMVWTVLVILYFTNMILIIVLPADHMLRKPWLAMILDTFFDVLAKAIYMKLILQVHRMVFDADGRAKRQLQELRRLMTVLWHSVSDVIIISVRHRQSLMDGKLTTTTVFSPAFPSLMGIQLPDSIQDHAAPALMVESMVPTVTIAQHVLWPPHEAAAQEQVLAAWFVDSSDIPSAGQGPEFLTKLHPVPLDHVAVRYGMRLAGQAWALPLNEMSTHPMHRADGQEIFCEVRVSREASNACITIVRDVTERHNRQEAERRAHEEALARQRDALAINRFTRHEVKNGLLAGIELCDNLRNVFEGVRKHVMARENDELSALPEGASPSLFENINNLLLLSGGNETLDPNSALTASFPPQPPSLEVANEQYRTAVSITRFLKDLHMQLHETLDTVLAEAMARDVIHEVYLPRNEPCQIRDLLTISGMDIGTSPLFPVKLTPPEIPDILLDPQLVRYIHRNAISNACKYGKAGGVVSTEVLFDASRRQLEIQVVNEPGRGHEELVALGEDAAIAVFAQGKRLHTHLDDTSPSGGDYKPVSSGDGAWIMQKCAKTMNGICKISFDEKKTVFSFTCPVELVLESGLCRNFTLPPGTWGVAVDDSKIQRKLMGRLLTQAGISQERIIILGQSPEEVEMLGQHLHNILEGNKCKVLVLVDENLDFRENDVDHVVLSGSAVMQQVLERMPQQEEERVLALVRSANDSAKDVNLYLQRTHGFFPKAPMQKERIHEILAPLWTGRFAPLLPSMQVEIMRSSSVERLNDSIPRQMSGSSELSLSGEFLRAIERIDRLVRKYEDRLSMIWPSLWSNLHSLKGDLKVLHRPSCEDDRNVGSFDILLLSAREAVLRIEALRGESLPECFECQWEELRDLLLSHVVKSLPSDLMTEELVG